MCSYCPETRAVRHSARLEGQHITSNIPNEITPAPQAIARAKLHLLHHLININKDKELSSKQSSILPVWSCEYGDQGATGKGSQLSSQLRLLSPGCKSE